MRPSFVDMATLTVLSALNTAHFQAICVIFCRLASLFGQVLEPFPGPLWWDAIATPDDVLDEASFRDTLRQLLTESFEAR